MNKVDIRENSITNKFYSISKEISRENSGDKILDISFFLFLFRLKNKNNNAFEQNDCQEFCWPFINEINSELNENKIIPQYKEFKYDKELKIRDIELKLYWISIRIYMYIQIYHLFFSKNTRYSIINTWKYI